MYDPNSILSHIKEIGLWQGVLQNMKKRILKRV